MVANGLLVWLSFGLGAQKNRRYRGWLEGLGFCFGGRQCSRSGLADKTVVSNRGWLAGLGFCFGGRHCALDLAFVRAWRTKASSL